MAALVLVLLASCAGDFSLFLVSAFKLEAIEGQEQIILEPDVSNSFNHVNSLVHTRLSTKMRGVKDRGVKSMLRITDGTIAKERFEALRKQKQQKAGKCGDTNVIDLKDTWKSYSPNNLPASTGVGTQQNSMLQTQKTGFTAHVAAVGEYDDSNGIVYAGLNIDGQLDGCLGPDCVTVCWCDEGSFLNVRGLQFEVTSIMKQGRSLCMGKCPMSKEFGTLIEKYKQSGDKCGEDCKFVFQIAEIPNAAFPIMLQGVETWVNGFMKAHVSFGTGDLGHLVPGYVCIDCCPHIAPMSLFVSDMRVGCIHSIKTSKMAIEVGRGEIDFKPTYRTVTLGNQIYYLPHNLPDESDCLAKKVKDLLQGGDAIVETCPAK